MATVSVHVKPGSSKGPLIVNEPDGSLTLYVRERAVEGAANDAVVKLLAEYFHIPKRSITIVRGRTSRTKVVELP